MTSIQAAVKSAQTTAKAVLLLLVLGPFYLTGCQTPPAAPPPAPPVAPPVDTAWVEDMLAAAREAIERDQITYPEQGSALQLYQSILARYPGQEDAIRGLEHIVEEYVRLALDAVERGQFATARSMLARGRIILPDHPSIEPTTEQIRLLSSAERIKVVLAQQDIASQNRNTWAQLRELGEIVPDAHCRYHIAAKNDAQGRVIYKALSQGSAAARLKAQVKIRLPASVERVCFAATQGD